MGRKMAQGMGQNLNCKKEPGILRKDNGAIFPGVLNSHIMIFKNSYYFYLKPVKVCKSSTSRHRILPLLVMSKNTKLPLCEF